MKSRPIKRRNAPIEFPVLAEWVDGAEGTNLIVLMISNGLGYRIRNWNNEKHKLGELSNGWVHLTQKSEWNKWKILGNPEKFGIYLINDKVIGELNL